MSPADCLLSCRILVDYACGLIAVVYFLFIRTAIAHSIREQVQTHTKCLNLIGYNYDGSSVHDEDLRGSFLPKVTTILREEEAVEQFTPILEKLTEPEIDKLERDRERDKRFVKPCHNGNVLVNISNKIFLYH